MSHGGTGDQLRDRAERDPATVEVKEIISTLTRESKSEQEATLTALKIVTKADVAAAKEAVDQLQRKLSCDQLLVRRRAAYGLGVIAHTQPEIVKDAIPALRESIEDQSKLVSSAALRTIARIGEAESSAVRDILPEMSKFLQDDALIVQESALKVVAIAAEEDPQTVATMVPTILNRFTTGQERHIASESFSQRRDMPRQLRRKSRDAKQADVRVQIQMAAVLATAAENAPDEFVKHLPLIVQQLAQESNQTIQRALIDVIGFIAEANPDAGSPAIPVLSRILKETDDTTVRAKTAWALAAIAAESPMQVTQAVSHHTNAFETLLTANSPQAIGAGVGLLSYVAEKEPAAIKSHLEKIRNLVETEESYIRGSCVWIIGYAGNHDDLELLQNRAETDRDLSVREAASEAREVLASRIASADENP